MSRLHPALLSLGLLATTLAAQSPAPGNASKAIDPANLDLSVRPCDDFYQFANGGWLKRSTIPPDKARFGSFEELADRNRDALHAILEETSKSTDWKKGSIEQKVGDFYASGMDLAAIEKLGAAPLKPWLDRIEAMRGPKDLAPVLAAFHGARAGGGGFGLGVSQDAKNSTQYIVQLNQGGLGLPDRDYYTKDDAKSKDLRAKYLAHVARMMVLVGEDPQDAGAHADSVLLVETRLAKASLTRVEQRDPQKTYHKMPVSELVKLAPQFDWSAYFKGRGIKQLVDLNVRQPGFFKEFGVLAEQITLPEWRAYLRWHAVSSAAPYLSQAFVDEAFDFNSRTLNGIPQQQDRWKRVQAVLDTPSALGEAAGQLYVRKAFSPEAKQKMLALIENLRAALKEKIVALPWMGEDTKQQALKKLAAFGVKVGYPDKWKDASKIEVVRGDFYGNIMRARAYETKRNIEKLGQPIDRTEWGMTPSTVNAYYSPTMNEIVFPAGILQPPFFDAKADDAVNYGGIGTVIGHEMTHGFDDQGSQFDAEGNLKNWWTDADRKAYESRTDLVVKEFDAFKALPDQNVNGKLTLGENIADLGGLKIAYAAWMKSQAGKRLEPIDGFSGPQRLFLNFAVIWRNVIRPEALRVRLNTDPHSPGQYRTIGTLSNLPEFFAAFGCMDGNAMKRPENERPSIW
ncbi:MAG: M13 family metallopeptidase [Holophagaceae bacterium]|nr:M13 family metallopeptidase [Holophagaceae bacterium]